MPRRIPSMADPIVCKTCRAVHTLAEPTNIDGSFVELRAAGWLDMAWKNRGRERWAWVCPACNPVLTSKRRAHAEAS